MAVSQTRYVDITSGVGASVTVAERQLIGRLFTDSPLIPPQTYKEFSSIEEVGAYFGTASNEYLRAQFYFSWVSKNITQPQLISFGRWVDTAQAAVIYGAEGVYSLATFTPISNGALNMVIGTTGTFTMTAINLSGAGSLSAVAGDVQTAIRAHTAGGADWTASTVTFDAINSRFNFVGGVAGPEILSIGIAGTGTDLAPLLGWTSATAIVGQGSAIETLTNCLTTSAGLSNNFGSFLFMPSLTTNQIIEVATWNNSQNVLYQYMVPVTAANASAVSTAIGALAGAALTLSPISTEYPEMVPMVVLAATNYEGVGTVQNYMFQTGFPLTPSVLTDLNADVYDALNVNYYVQTQNAGQFINFYATGVLTGSGTDPVDQNVYANEQWLKDALGAQLMSLLLDLPNVSANNQGVAQVTAVMQSVIQQALTNRTISVGKPLDAIQQLYITNATGSNTAWRTVQSAGYWLNVQIVPYVVDSVTKYKIVYTLIYSKDDVVRLIQGSDILI